MLAYTSLIRSAASRQIRVHSKFSSNQIKFVCQTCRKNFSTTSTCRIARQAVKDTTKDQKYPSRLLIYDAGDARTTWVTFWKAVALLQWGTALVFAVPYVWNNEKQPDPRLRKAQGVIVGMMATIPSLTLAYLTAPYTHQIFLNLPSHARSSLPSLINFARSLSSPTTSNITATANTKLEFVTLRIFPIPKFTTAFLHEMRALPAKRMRLANLQIAMSTESRERWERRSWGRRVLGVLNEPRWKFWVKEGRAFTMKTGVPGVWEELVKRIHDQTLAEEKGMEDTKGVKRGVTVIRKPVVVSSAAQQGVKRQTARVTRR